MKLWICLCILFVTTSSFANKCDIHPLREEIISKYQEEVLPVRNEKGEIGHARAKNFAVADYLLNFNHESILVANFDLDIKWLKGTSQTVRTLVVATVNPKTCTIENYERDNTLAESIVSR